MLSYDGLHERLRQKRITKTHLAEEVGISGGLYHELRVRMAYNSNHIEGIIKHVHYILTHDTSDSALAWFTVGDYKRKANTVGSHETAKPRDVPVRMRCQGCCHP